MVMKKANPEFNIYYKEFHLDPACEYYIRCERLRGKSSWYVYFKYSAIERVIISKSEVRGYLKSARNVK
jgi:hypothetical protein